MEAEFDFYEEYGYDRNNPDSWAGLASTKSRTWFVAYHSGFSFFVGKHTLLFFGRENLVAFKASFVGAGVSISFGVKSAPRSISRSVGMSDEAAKQVGRKSDIIDLQGTAERYGQSNKELDQLYSAKGIYNAISTYTSSISAAVPFCANDIEGSHGYLDGVSVEFAIGTSSNYLITAKPFFHYVPVVNITKGPTTIAASLGTLEGIWMLDEMYSLWNEVAHSETDEYPFRNYNIDPLFHKYRNQKAIFLKQAKLHDIANQAGLDRVKFLTNGRDDPLHNLAIINETKELTDNFNLLLSEGKNVMDHPLMAFIPYQKRYMFKIN